MKSVSWLVLAFLVIVSAGCSGINASKSVSPLDFLLPGLMHQPPPTPALPIGTNAAPLLADCR